LAGSWNPESLGGEGRPQLHPHIKPIGLITRLIAATTHSGEVVSIPVPDPSSCCMLHANSGANSSAAISPTAAVEQKTMTEITDIVKTARAALKQAFPAMKFSISAREFQYWN